MKRMLVLMLALAMVFALCACGGNSAADSDPTVKDTVETPTEPSAGEPTDAPEVKPTKGNGLKHTLKTESLNVAFTYEDGENSFVGRMSIVDNASPAILHISVHQDIDYVYEKDDNGVITKYECTDGFITYEKDTELTQEELQDEVASFMFYFTLTGWNFTSLYPEFSYEQFGEDESIEDYFFTDLLISLYVDENDVWYKVYNGEEQVAFIAVDPETGIFTCVKGADFSYYASEFHTEADLPYYK